MMANQGRTSRAQRRHALAVAQLAVASLHAELCLYPKPGLVSPVDSGSHDDMDAGTFMRSLFALRHYFRRICLAGMQDAPFSRLKQLGVEAEAAMLAATHGVNTHRGAIFSLGLLCAAAGRLYATTHGGSGARTIRRDCAGQGQGQASLPLTLRLALLQGWGAELVRHAGPAALTCADDANANASNGQRVAQRYAASGAREEAALGLPSVFEVALPALHAARQRGASVAMARTDALFALMAHVSDSNVYHRAGTAGAQTVREHARRFLDLGGTRHPRWRANALESHRAFVAQRLSPGGAADLLAAACFVDAIACMDATLASSAAAPVEQR